MTENDFKEFREICKRKWINDELKDIYLREVNDRNKEYE